jgi:methylenetetrahydrofolate dehydrogenase (NADP+)/methenyltetrahydrofolate cyclohydrolase
MTEILDGRNLARTIRSEVATKVERFVAAGGRPPCLAAVLVGEDPASQVYVRSKAKALARAGCTSRTVELPGDAPAAEVRGLLERLNADREVDGILVQLPLPGHLDTETILETVSPDKDVDGFHAFNVGRLWRDRPRFVPATPAGVIELLDRRGIELSGRQAVIVGRSNVVGKPLAVCWWRL